MNILLVEDEYTWAETVIGELESRYRNSKVQRIATEKAFSEEIAEIKRNPPDLVLMDVMLRYDDPERELEIDPEWYEDYKNKGGRFTAGIRCVELLAEQDVAVPVLLYTVLDEEPLHNQMPSFADCLYLKKNANLQSLYDKIDQILASGHTSSG